MLGPWEKKRGSTECSSDCLNPTNENKSQTRRTQVKGKVMIVKERCLQGSEEEVTLIDLGISPFGLLYPRN